MKPKRYPIEIREEARRLWSNGLSFSQVGRRLGIGGNRPDKIVSRWIRELEEPKALSRKRPEPLLDRPCADPDCSNVIPAGTDGRQKFCGRGCWDRNRPPSPRKILYHCSKCGGLRNKTQSPLCMKCHREEERERRNKRPIRSFFLLNSASRAKCNTIRALARQELAESDRPKKCQLCGFDVVVHTCHIKGIMDFSEDTPLGVVNGLDNLIYLCPNHHAMLDTGQLELELL